MHLSEPIVAGLLDELEKISKKSKAPEDPRIGVGEKILGTGTGLAAAGIPAGLAGAGLGALAQIPADQAANMGDVAKIRQAMNMPDPVELGRSPVTQMHGGGANAMPVVEDHRAQLKLKPGQHSRSFSDPSMGIGTLSHEMGHGSVVRSRLGRALRHSQMPARAIGGLGSVGMAALGDPEGDAVKYAPLVGAAGALPTMAEETIASGKGLMALRRAGYGGGRIARAAGRNLLGLGSYAAGMAAPMVATPYAIGKARQYWRKKLEEGQEEEG